MQIITAMRQACLEAFSRQPRRLVEPVYHAQIVVRGDHSGKVYAALQRKRAEVVDEPRQRLGFFSGFFYSGWFPTLTAENWKASEH